MAVVSIYIISKAGGMIYQYDHNIVPLEYEKTFSYPLDIVLECINNRTIVTFGQMDNIKGISISIVYLNCFLINYKILSYHSCLITMWKFCGVLEFFPSCLF